MLAQEIVARFHDPAAAGQALADFEARFRQGAIPDDIPEVSLAGAPMAIAQVLKQAELAPSTSEAMRNIEQGGVRVDGDRVEDKGLKLAGRHLRRAGRKAQVRPRDAGVIALLISVPRTARSWSTVARSAASGADWWCCGAPSAATRNAQAQALLKRVLQFRVFPDDAGRMNRSLRDLAAGSPAAGRHGQAGLLLVPQFTLAADTHSGTRAELHTRGGAAGRQRACSICSWRWRGASIRRSKPVSLAPT